MGKHLITVEVDTDRTKYDTLWEADYGHVPPMPDGDVADYARTFGAGPGAQWDYPPLTRIVSVERADAAGTLSRDARAIIAAMVAETDDLDLIGLESVDEIQALSEVWREIRDTFPLSLCEGIVLTEPTAP